jgi:leucyl-tRNA synthetase
MLGLALQMAMGGKLDMGQLMKAALADPTIQKHKKDAPKYAGKLAKTAFSLQSDILTVDEYETLSLEAGFLSKEFGCQVIVLSADEPGEDPLGKSRNAEPGRPAIYVEA